MESRETIIALITSAGSAFIGWIVGRRKENADISTIQLENSQKVIDMFTAMNEKLEAKVDQLSQKVDELTIEIENLRVENHNLKIGKAPKVIKTKPIK